MAKSKASEARRTDRGRDRRLALGQQEFRARIIFKSSHVDEILMVAESTNALDIICGGFYRYLDSGQPRFGRYSIQSGDLIVDWRDVSSFRTWVEPK